LKPGSVHGPLLGLVDGISVCSPLGVTEGVSDEALDGIALGLALKVTEGSLDGKLEGSFVGAPVGTSNGGSVIISGIPFSDGSIEGSIA
jgi:hypothetical protein